MLKITWVIFLVLHGIVHLLYAGQSWRVFELRPVWYGRTVPGCCQNY